MCVCLEEKHTESEADIRVGKRLTRTPARLQAADPAEKILTVFQLSEKQISPSLTVSSVEPPPPFGSLSLN